MHAWTWLLQRVSAVVILVALAFHIAMLHFANHGASLTYADILARFKTPGLITLDILLLIFGLYHAIYGVYAIYLDFQSGKKERAVVLGLFILTGLGFLAFGMYGFIYMARTY